MRKRKAERPSGDIAHLLGTALLLWALILGGSEAFWWCVREAPPQVLLPAVALLAAAGAGGFALGAVRALGDWLRSVIRDP